MTHYIVKSRSLYFVLPFYNRFTDVSMIFVLLQEAAFDPEQLSHKIQIKAKDRGVTSLQWCLDCLKSFLVK